MCPPLIGNGVRRRPTLPHPGGCSTIGAEGLSFRVRNGTGRFPLAMTAVTLWSCVQQQTLLVLGSLVAAHPWSWVWCGQPGEVCVCISRVAQWTRSIFVASPRPISTGQLHTLRCFHFRPINPVVLPGALTLYGVGVLILEQASRLDAFSGYPFRT